MASRSAVRQDFWGRIKGGMTQTASLAGLLLLTVCPSLAMDTLAIGQGYKVGWPIMKRSSSKVTVHRDSIFKWDVGAGDNVCPELLEHGGKVSVITAGDDGYPRRLSIAPQLQYAMLDGDAGTATAHLPRQATPHGRSGNRDSSKAESISDALQEYLQKNRMEYLKAPAAGALLEQWGLLADSRQRAGKPLRDLLRAGVTTGQEQPGGPHSTWFIRRVDEKKAPAGASPSANAGGQLRVTAADLRKGQIRVPSTSTAATKELFPTAKSRVTVILRGKSTSCRWDPRKMPDGQLRSGVLHVGAVLRKLVRKDEALTATREEGGAVVID